jgi:hypothetical protein
VFRVWEAGDVGGHWHYCGKEVGRGCWEVWAWSRTALDGVAVVKSSGKGLR